MVDVVELRSAFVFAFAFAFAFAVPLMNRRGAQWMPGKGRALSERSELRRPRHPRAPQRTLRSRAVHQGRRSFGYFSFAGERKVTRLEAKQPIISPERSSPRPKKSITKPYLAKSPLPDSPGQPGNGCRPDPDAPSASSAGER